MMSSDNGQEIINVRSAREHMESRNRRLPLGELQETSESRRGRRGEVGAEPEQPHFQTCAPKNKSLEGREWRGVLTGARLPQLNCSDRCGGGGAGGEGSICQR